MMPRPIWCRFERQLALRACSRARAKTGKRIAAKMAMMAITTSSSIRVNPRRFIVVFLFRRPVAPNTERFAESGGVPLSSRLMGCDCGAGQDRREREDAKERRREEDRGWGRVEPLRSLSLRVFA